MWAKSKKGNKSFGGSKLGDGEAWLFSKEKKIKINKQGHKDGRDGKKGRNLEDMAI